MKFTNRSINWLGASCLALGLVAAPALTPLAAADDKEITLTGCLVKGDGDGNPYLLTNAPNEPAMVGSSSAPVAPTGVGTSGEFKNVFYWLDGDGDLKDHIGHQVEVKGDLKGDVEDGEIKLDRKDNWTEMTVKADGKSMKARVPNMSIVAASDKDKDRKGSIAVRRVDVEHIRMIAANCAP